MPLSYDRVLNPEQCAAVLQGDGPTLVLAGAGSGKTRTLVYRVAYLLEQGVLPQQILLLTFTNKASREMLNRVETILGRTPQGLWGGTFHHIANRVLRRYARAIGYENNFSILDEEDATDLLKLCVKDEGVPQTRDRFPLPRVLKSIISVARNAQRPVDEVLAERHPKFARYQAAIQGIAARYDQRKRTANAMDFDDLLVNFLHVLEHPESHHALASQFRYVLVDEYQDTNRIQAAIVARLSSVHQNVFVVGDDAQSIYSFRAADIANILDFSKHFPGAKTFRIETNYRSTPEVLRVANAVIAHNTGQFRKELRPVLRSGARPQLIQTNTTEEEARMIAQHILALRADGIPLREIAVLFRATHLSEFLEMELVKRDIPYDYRGGVRFFERSHIKDVLAFMKIFANPADEAAWLRVLRMQRGIGDVGATDIIERIRQMVPPAPPEGESPPFDPTGVALDLPLRLSRGWQDFQGMARSIAGSLEPAMMIRALAKGSYREYLESAFPNAEERLEDLEQLALFAEKYDVLGEFLGDVSLQELYQAERVGPNASEQERIVLSTIHQAKGLEWRAVFVMGLTSATFPNRRALLEEGGVEEERRLFYVAVTRAKELLRLTYALAGGGESGYLHGPSPFLSEIPSELLEPIGVSRITPRSTWGNFSDHSDDEPIIVLDAMGERNKPSVDSPKPQARRSFLRSVDEL